MPAARYIMPWNIYVSCFARKTTSCLISRTKTTFAIVWIVTNDTFRVVSESSCNEYVFTSWQTEQLVSCLNHRAKTMGLHARSLKKVKWPVAKLDSTTKKSWIAIAILQASLPTTTFLLKRASFIRLLRLLINKIAVGKREAVAFKYRLKYILSCWCQPAPLAIPL